MTDLRTDVLIVGGGPDGSAEPGNTDPIRLY